MSAQPDDAAADGREYRFVRRLRMAVLVTLFGIILVSLCHPGRSLRVAPVEPVEPPPVTGQPHALRLLRLHNDVRADAGLPRLALDARLDWEALQWSYDKPRSGGAPDVNDTDALTADQAMVAWLSDPAARARALDPRWRWMGVALPRADAKGVMRWVVKYGEKPGR